MHDWCMRPDHTCWPPTPKGFEGKLGVPNGSTSIYVGGPASFLFSAIPVASHLTVRLSLTHHSIIWSSLKIPPQISPHSLVRFQSHHTWPSVWLSLTHHSIIWSSLKIPPLISPHSSIAHTISQLTTLRSCLNLSHPLTSQHLTSHLASPLFTTPSPHPSWPNLTSPFFTSSHPSSPHPRHLTSHFTSPSSPHLTSPLFTTPSPHPSWPHITSPFSPPHFTSPSSSHPSPHPSSPYFSLTPSHLTSAHTTSIITTSAFATDIFQYLNFGMNVHHNSNCDLIVIHIFV